MDTEQIKASVRALLEARKVLTEAQSRVREAQQVLSELYKEDRLPEWSIVFIDGVAYELQMDSYYMSFDSINEKANVHIIH